MARTAKTPFLVLGLLSRGPMSGYDIAAEVREAIGHFWHESFGSIYPVLARLTRAGLIRPAARRAAARRRQPYAITPKGRTALRRWLEDAPEPDLVRNELLLKLYFGAATRPPVLRSHLAAYRARQEARLDYLDEGERAVRGAGPEDARHREHWLLCLDLGRRVTEARLEWIIHADAALERLQREEDQALTPRR